MAPSNASQDDPSLFAVILAGGHGERFWPLSRKARPKHHLALFSPRSLLESTIERLQGLVPNERILVLTGADQAEAVRALVPNIPEENLIVEPERRDTAAAMALAAGIIARRDPQGTAMVLPSDHHIPSTEGLQHTLLNAVVAARESQSIVAVAIPPDSPCPAFGYLELGEAIPLSNGRDVLAFPVLRFREKPSVAVAQEYLNRGNFRWNAGMFVWTIPTLKDALRLTSPELAAFCEDLEQTDDIPQFLETHFSSVPKISFDYAVMEKLSGALAVEAEFAWDDLGGWPAAGKYLPSDMDGNASNASLQSKDSRGNIVFSTDPNQHVALLGVENLIIVNTGDALLVCPRDQAERLREVVGSLPPSLR
ncbi:MAG: hypothetical protein RLZZ399_2074 [Verrucomicrobiota bacterium]|jgi:mannose-1-phosphate guanylyltransferase